MSLTDREKQVINWSTQEIDQDVKLGDKIEEMLETDGAMFSAEDHAEVDHSEITGVPSIEGLLDETAHDVLDHAGLTGVPSIEGLLDETAHDLLDHAGLPGIPGVAANQAASVEASTPTVTEFNDLLTKLKAAGLMAADYDS